MPHKTTPLSPLTPQTKPNPAPPHTSACNTSGGFVVCPRGLKITWKGCGFVGSFQSQISPLHPCCYQQECAGEMSRSEPEPQGGGFPFNVQFCVRGYFYEALMERMVTSLVVVPTWPIHQWLGGTVFETVKPQTMQNSTPRGTSPGGWWVLPSTNHFVSCKLRLLAVSRVGSSSPALAGSCGV